MKLELKMDKQKARQLYELADRLSKLDVNTLSEEQQQQRSTMIAKLQEEAQGVKEEFNGEYDDEGAVLKNVLQVLKNEVELPLSEYIPKNVLRRSLSPIQNLVQSGINNLPIPVNYESIQEANGEYDDEAGMVQSNLRTMARAVNGLLDTIEDNDNLPEWAQEKIAKAEMMTTSVWDYLLSQKEQGMDPKVQGVAEAKKPSPKLTPVDMKKSEPVSEEINNEAYERLQKVFAFKNYES